MARRSLPTTFPSPAHRRVWERLTRLLGDEGAADFFADACEIGQLDPAFRTSTHLIGHLMREVQSMVTDLLLGLPAARQALNAMAPEPSGDQTQSQEIRAILAALGLENDEVAKRWLVVRKWHKPAHHDEFAPPRPFDSEFAEYWLEFVRILDRVLDRAEAVYAAYLHQLDLVKLEGHERGEAFVRKHLAPGATAAVDHFLNGLSEEWLPGLRRGRFFAFPRAPIVDEVQRRRAFPPWPQSAYLARIAARRPREVVEVILDVPETENLSIHVDFLRAAFAMPADEADRIVQREVQWVTVRPERTYLFPELGAELAAKLASAGKLDSATLLLRSLLGFRSPTSQAIRERDPLVQEWQYEPIIAKGFRALEAVDSGRALTLLAELIVDGQGNGSSGWRATVEDHEQNGPDGPLDAILRELRDLSLRLATDGATLTAMVETLEAREAAIFRRVALYLLAERGGLAPSLVSERARQSQAYGDFETFHERASMLRTHFGTFSDEDKTAVVNAIRRYAFEDRPARRGRRDEPDSRYTFWRWLTIIGEQLHTEELKAEYAVLVREYGAETHPTFLSWRTVSWGPRTPRESADLLALSDDALIAFLTQWQPTPREHFAPSREGLAMELKSAATKEPRRLSRLAREIARTNPQYVAGFLWGLHEVAQNTRDQDIAAAAFDWDALLDLADFTSKQETTDRAEYSPGNWTWARQTAVDILRDAARIFAPKDEQRTTRIWSTLKRLLSDADPTPEREDESSWDAETFLLNTVRGRALEAGFILLGNVLESSLAVHEQLKAEVFTTLQSRISSSNEPSVRLRSSVGHFFNTLLAANPGEATAMVERLFPTDDATWSERVEAWWLYLKWNRPWARAFPVLFSQYQLTARKIPDVDPKLLEDYSEHIVWLAVWGMISPTSEDRLLQRFVSAAQPVTREHALADVGRALHQDKTPLPTEVVDRLRTLWTWWRIASPATSDAADLAAFGWWFTSGVFDDQWATDELLEVLTLTDGRVEWDHEVIKKLAQGAPTRPTKVAACLQKLVDSHHDQWLVARNIPALTEALRALASVPEGAGPARELVSRLLARGYSGFADTLANQPG